MWLLVQRSPHPDLPYWRGRRSLAALDAVAWPAIFMMLLMNLPGDHGLIVPVAAGLAALVTTRRLYRALWLNHRYCFTTCGLAKFVAALLVVGAILKLAIPS